MMVVTSVSGNIFHDKEYSELKGCERLQVTRQELEKTRMRKKTDCGTDVGLSLEPGKTLRHGDVISHNGKTILVEQLAEKLISVRLKDSESSALIGHIIGNMHRPISIKDSTVTFPIQADSELETFERLFSNIPGAKLSIRQEVFTPHAGADVHGHS